MRTNPFAAVTLAVAFLAAPLDALAWVVVRAPRSTWPRRSTYFTVVPPP